MGFWTNKSITKTLNLTTATKHECKKINGYPNRKQQQQQQQSTRSHTCKCRRVIITGASRRWMKMQTLPLITSSTSNKNNNNKTTNNNHTNWLMCLHKKLYGYSCDSKSPLATPCTKSECKQHSSNAETEIMRIVDGWNVQRAKKMQTSEMVEPNEWSTNGSKLTFTWLTMWEDGIFSGDKRYSDW